MPTEVALVVHSARAIDARGGGDDVWLAVAVDGRIAARGEGPGWQNLEARTVSDAAGKILSPGLIDIHCHGGMGASFDGSIPELTAALEFHVRAGSTSVVPSLVSASLDELEERLAELARIQHPAFAGTHLEGPFLAASHRGAHDPAALREAEPRDVERLIAASAGTLRHVTMAPELPGAAHASTAFLSAGVRVAVGHTAAGFETALAAFTAGATLLTHAFNGMPGLHHREPGPVGAAIQSPGVVLELILDGVHVHDVVARFLFELAPGRIALVSDAMAATGCADGDYQLGSVAVAVRAGVARLRDGDSIAGSTITLADALRRAIVNLGLEPERAIAAATLTPARAIGLDDRGLLEPGQRGDLVLFDADWRVQRVWLAGQEQGA